MVYTHTTPPALLGLPPPYTMSKPKSMSNTMPMPMSISMLRSMLNTMSITLPYLKPMAMSIVYYSCSYLFAVMRSPKHCASLTSNNA